MEDARQEREQVTLGVDTHAEIHVAAALDERGRLLDTCTIPTTTAGYAELVRWTSQYGDLAQGRQLPRSTHLEGSTMAQCTD